MTTNGSRRRIVHSLSTLLILALAGSPVAFAQDAPKPTDEALEGLLKKLGDDKPATPDAAKKPDPKDTAPKPKAESAPTKPASKPVGEVAPKDEDLDNLLEKLGTSRDKPSADDKSPGGGKGEPMPDDPRAPKPGEDKKPDPGTLTGKDKDLDEHIAEITGKRRKKKEQQQQQRAGQEQGPLSDVIKQMRDVEKKLGDAETGEETRKEQTQIVKKLDTLIDQMRSMSPQRKMQKGIAMKPGPKPGQQPGDQPGTTGGNAPMTKPLKPETKRSLLAGKDSWGHLPPEMRQEMENVFKEEPLPSREELVRRYYLSVSKKSLNRGE